MYDGIGAFGMTIRMRYHTGSTWDTPPNGSGYTTFCNKNGTFRNRKWPVTTRTPARKQEISKYRPMSLRRRHRISDKSVAIAGGRYEGVCTDDDGEIVIAT